MATLIPLISALTGLYLFAECFLTLNEFPRYTKAETPLCRIKIEVETIKYWLTGLVGVKLVLLMFYTGFHTLFLVAPLVFWLLPKTICRLQKRYPKWLGLAD